MDLGRVYASADEVTLMLINAIRSEILAKENKLPPEIELAQRLGVSRNAIRESLARLEREGLVTRKQGIGTLINRHVFLAETRLDLNLELIPTLERIGKKAETSFIHIMQIKALGEIAEKLQMKPGDDLISVERLICADGSPAIYCIDYIPAGELNVRDLKGDDFQPSIYAFLKKHRRGEVSMNLTEVRAVPAEGKIAGSLWIAEGTPLLCLSEVGYDLMEAPILCSEEYLMDRVIHHVIFRKKI